MIPTTGNLHRLVTQKGDNKKGGGCRLFTSRSAYLFADPDVNKVELRMFTAGDLRRVPQFVPDVTDICANSHETAIASVMPVPAPVPQKNETREKERENSKTNLRSLCINIVGWHDSVTVGRPTVNS